MQYRYIGKTGLRVTPIGLGTMSFGSWSYEAEAFRIMDKAYERGINFFDTAELYPVPPRVEDAGITETIIGKWLKGKPRDSIILASKVAGAANGWFVPPIRHGYTAIDSFHIKKAIEGSESENAGVWAVWADINLRTKQFSISDKAFDKSIA